MFRNTIGQGENALRIGLGSFAFRYAVGFGTFLPPRPMTVLDFLSEAHRLGFKGVQLCENLNYSNLSINELLAIRGKAQELDLFVELGMRDITPENLSRHLDIAELLSSRFLRVVLGANRPFPEEKPEILRNLAIKTLREALPRCKKQNVTIGIENHFDLPTEDLVKIVEEINDEQVGLILDTTNCLGFIESPEETLNICQSHLLSIHLKDFTVGKVEAGYLITGTPLGEGRLRTQEILKLAFKFNPNLSIIMEMTIRRQEQQSVEETLVWEKKMIEKSANYLRETPFK